MASAFFTTIHAAEKLDQLKNSLHQHSHVIHQCRIWNGQRDSHGYGVYQVYFRGKWVKLQVHRIAYYLADPSRSLHRSIHVSHLCHNKLCINVSHLSYESQKMNNQRQICRAEGQCTGHRGKPKCKLSLVIMQFAFFSQLC